MEDEEEGREGKRKKVSTSTHLSKSVVGGCSSSSSGISHQLSCLWCMDFGDNHE